MHVLRWEEVVAPWNTSMQVIIIKTQLPNLMDFSRRFRLTKNLTITAVDITATKTSSSPPSVAPIIVLVTTNPSLCGSTTKINISKPTGPAKQTVTLVTQQTNWGLSSITQHLGDYIAADSYGNFVRFHKIARHWSVCWPRDNDITRCRARC